MHVYSLCTSALAGPALQVCMVDYYIALHVDLRPDLHDDSFIPVKFLYADFIDSANYAFTLLNNDYVLTLSDVVTTF